MRGSSFSFHCIVKTQHGKHVCFHCVGPRRTGRRLQVRALWWTNPGHRFWVNDRADFSLLLIFNINCRNFQASSSLKDKSTSTSPNENPSLSSLHLLAPPVAGLDPLDSKETQTPHPRPRPLPPLSLRRQSFTEFIEFHFHCHDSCVLIDCQPLNQAKHCHGWPHTEVLPPLFVPLPFFSSDLMRIVHVGRRPSEITSGSASSPFGSSRREPLRTEDPRT